MENKPTQYGRCHACNKPLMRVFEGTVFYQRERDGHPHHCPLGDFPTFEEIGRHHRPHPRISQERNLPRSVTYGRPPPTRHVRDSLVP